MKWGQTWSDLWGLLSKEEVEELPTPYLTIDEANALLSELTLTEDRQVWIEATEPDKLSALSLATRDIDSLNYAGSKADSSQELKFPRGTDSTVPQAVQEACAMIAVERLDGKRPGDEVENQGLIGTGYASVRTTYDRTSGPEHLAAGIVSFEAWRLIKPFLRDPSTFKQSRV